MDWLGIGVVFIGIALLILTFLLIKPLTKLAVVLDSLQKTTDGLPTVLENTSKQAAEIFQKGNETLAHVNNEINQITPVFYIVRDAGESSQELSSLALDKTLALKSHTTEAREFALRQRLQGIYAPLAFFFFLYQRRKQIKQALSMTE
ncbi:DUF948 domain-containing protein [Sporosarcina sp. CAU 1771]